MPDEVDASRTTLLQQDSFEPAGPESSTERLTLTAWDALPESQAGLPATKLPDKRQANEVPAIEHMFTWLLPGQQISHFRVSRPLGRGGTGAVYEALDLETGSPVALKVLHRVLAAQLVSFKAEFRVAVQIAHANVVTPLELATDDGRWLIAMELIPGRPLAASLIARPDRLATEVRVLCDTFLQLLDGLEALHEGEIVHRDLKPSNVLVTPEGRVRIVDFGLAVLRSPGQAWLDASGRVVGSPGYMAPEQIAREAITTATDLYCVGGMLFEALTGHLPFAGPPYAMMMAKLTQGAPDPRSRARDVPESLAVITRRLLARDPRERPTLDQLRDELRAGDVRRHSDSRPPRRELVGRERELETLRAVWNEACADGPLVLSVLGDSGLGKTALVQTFAAELQLDPAVLVLFGHCHQLETIPHKGFDGAIDALRSYLLTLSGEQLEAVLPEDFAAAVELFPVLSDVGVGTVRGLVEVAHDELARRERAHGALRTLLDNIAGERRILIALDDVQWGDVDGARLLESLVAGRRGRALMIILCIRADEAEDSRFLRHLRLVGRREPDSFWRSMTLGRLQHDTAVEMAQRLLGSHDRELAERIAWAADGEPFLVEQLALSGAEPDAPRGIRDVVMSRASRLGAGATRLLELVAVCTQPIPERLLASCLELPDPRPLCAQLVALRLLRASRSDAGPMIIAYHDRLRAALADALEPEEQTRLHLSLATHGESENLLPAHSLADHFAQAGLKPRAAVHAFEAGITAARSLAFDLAADMFARVSLLITEDAELARRARQEHARCLHLAGRCAEAGDAYMRARLDAEGDAQLLLTGRAVEAWLACGRVDRVFEVLEPLLRAAGSSYPASKLAVISSILLGIARTKLALMQQPRTRESADPKLMLRSDLLWAAGKGLVAVLPAQGAIIALRSVFPALASGDPHRIGRSLAFIGSGFVPLLEREGERAMRWARELAAREHDPHLEVMIEIADCARGLLCGEWETSVRAAKAVLAQAPAVEATTAWEQAMAHTLLVSAYEYQGELQAMERACLACLRDVRARGDQITAVTVVSAHGYVRAARHDARGLDELIEDMQSAMEGWRVGEGLWDFYGLRLRVLRALCWADPHTARRLIDDKWPLLEQHGVLQMPIVRGPALMTRLAVTIGQLELDPASRVLRSEAGTHMAQLAGESRADAAVHVALAGAALANLQKANARQSPMLAEAERAAERADLRVVRRMITRLRATLQGDVAEQQRVEHELERLGVVRPEAWARFVTPGWSSHA